MEEKKTKISELPASTNLDNLYTLGVNSQDASVKVPLGSIIGNIKNNLSDEISRATDTEQQLKDGKADKVTDAANGNLAAFDSSGNLSDSSIVRRRLPLGEFERLCNSTRRGKWWRRHVFARRHDSSTA